jgi:predicted ATPase
MSHPFGDLLRQYRARKSGLSQTRLAELAGYDQAVLVRMAQGQKDLTGPSGRERVVRLIGVLRDEGVLATLDEANALLRSAAMPPLFDGQAEEAVLVKSLRVSDAVATPPTPGTPAVGSPTRRRTNLPAPLTRFVGREREMAEVLRLLKDNRLLTLTGSGGCGKTRLAIEVGAVLVGALHRPLHHDRPVPVGGAAPLPPVFPDGVWLVELAPLVDGRFVADAVASTLGLGVMSRTALEVVADHLSDRQCLLILDNCEHLIQGCATLAVALLRACPMLYVLVTSREPLNVPGEVTWRVPPMAPDDAAQLFVERARAAHPDFALTEATAPVVAHICRRLDDMPLALELAAARLRAFSVGQIAARLDDAFRVLSGGNRAALPRQQTLRATIDWSYDLLANEERTLLCELSVFSGGWTLDAAGAVHGNATPELLEQLVNKSVVVAEQRLDDQVTGTRYRMLETIRQYARERLAAAGEDAERRVRQRHLEHYAGLEQTARPHFVGGAEEKLWAGILRADSGNLRAALDWAMQVRDWQRGLQLMECIFAVWNNEPGDAAEMAKGAVELLVANPDASDVARASGMIMMGQLMDVRGDMIECANWVSQASALAHRINDEHLILNVDSWLGKVTPDYTHAVAILNPLIEYCARTGRKLDQAFALESLGLRTCLNGDYPQAIRLLENAAALARDAGELIRAPRILWRLGQAYLAHTDYARARKTLQECVTLLRQSSYFYTEPLVDLGTAGLYTGDYALARDVLGECFTYTYKNDNLERVAQGLVLAAGLAQVLGKPHEAARLLGVAAAIRRDHHTHGVFERELFAEYDRRLPAVQAAMDPAEFDKAWAEGQQLTIQEAIAEALAI